MSPHRERVVRPRVVSEHLVQLFDEPESLAASLGEYLYDGWTRGDRLLVVARPAHWALTAPELEARGLRVADAIASGRLVVLDAATTMASFMVYGDPARDKFRASVGELVRTLCREPQTGLTIYGEMVDLLAAEGNYRAAERLEALWNDLGESCSFRLLCGYSAVNFGDENTSKQLNDICALHTDASAPETDLLARWLLANRRPGPHVDYQP